MNKVLSHVHQCPISIGCFHLSVHYSSSSPSSSMHFISPLPPPNFPLATHLVFSPSVLSHLLSSLLIAVSILPWPFNCNPSVISPCVFMKYVCFGKYGFMPVCMLGLYCCLQWTSQGESLCKFNSISCNSQFALNPLWINSSSHAPCLPVFLSVSVWLWGQWHQRPASRPLRGVEWNLCHWQPVQHPRYNIFFPLCSLPYSQVSFMLGHAGIAARQKFKSVLVVYVCNDFVWSSFSPSREICNFIFDSHQGERWKCAIRLEKHYSCLGDKRGVEGVIEGRRW